MKPIVIASILLAALLAGCAGGAEAASAKDLLSEAKERAALWRSDAKLVGVAGIETRHRELLMGGEQEPDDYVLAGVPGNDSDIGDGKAPAWIYIFGSDERRYVVVVRGDGDVLHAAEEEDTEDIGFGADPITNWTVDSDRASDLAAAANNTYERLRGDDDYSAFFLLGQADTDRVPYWLLGLERVYSEEDEEVEEDLDQAGNQDEPDEDEGDEDEDEVGEDGIILVVNAETGEVHDFGFALEGLALDFAAEYGQDSGQLLAVVAESNTHTFQLERRHAQVTIAVAMDMALPLSALTAHITGPDGESYDVDLDAGLLGGSALAATTFSPGSAGEWTVEVTNGGVLEDYDLSWCTEGLYFEITIGFPFGSGNDACAARGAAAPPAAAPAALPRIMGIV